MKGICSVFLFLVASLTIQTHAQREIGNHAPVMDPVWQPSFSMGLSAETAAWGGEVTLSKFLARNVGYDAGDHGCDLKIALFYFRVNSAGKVDSVYAQGGLSEKMKATITANIHATSGKWKMPGSTLPGDQCWFVYPAIDPGRSKSCSEQEKMNRNAHIALLNLYSKSGTTVDHRGRIILPPGEIYELSEK